MLEDAAFLTAIDAYPGDSLPRLVYADWLEERGEPDRATMIRVMEQMRPLAIWSDEFQSLRPIRNAHRKTLDAAWLDRMGYSPVHHPMFGTIPESPRNRRRLAEEFIDIWHGGLNPGDGHTEEELRDREALLGVQFPRELRNWYLLAGKRKDIWSNHDRIVKLSRLEHEQGKLIIRWENQGVTHWYLRTEEQQIPDPPVWCEHDNRIVAKTLTEFALVVLVFESQCNVIVSEIDPLPNSIGEFLLPPRFEQTQLPTEYWFHGGIQYREAKDSIIYSLANDDFYGYFRTEVAFQQLVAELGDRVKRQ